MIFVIWLVVQDLKYFPFNSSLLNPCFNEEIYTVLIEI